MHLPQNLISHNQTLFLDLRFFSAPLVHIKKKGLATQDYTKRYLLL